MSTNAISLANPARSNVFRGSQWAILAILWLTLLVSYFDRVAIAAALPFLSAELHLRPSAAGLVAGALLLTYTLVQVPAGYLSDRFGQRRIIAAAITWWTMFSVLTGVVGGSLAALLAVRLLMGVGEGFHPPPLWRVMSNWFGPGRRGLPLALMLSALTLGPALAPSIAFPVVATLGWRWVFYLTAAPGLLCVLLVLRFLWDSPGRRDLTATRAPDAPVSDRTVRCEAGRWWVPHIWLTFTAFLFFGFVLYGLMGWLPTYLVTYRGLDLMQAGLFATSPYLAGTVGMLGGAWLCQRRFNHLRRRFVSATYLATAVCIAATVLAPTVTLAGLCLTASGFFLYSGLGPFWAVPMDVVRPDEVGTWLGFINMGTQISGFLGPILIGWLVQVSGSFTPALLAMIGSLVLAAGCLTAITGAEAPPSAESAVPG